MYIWVSSRGELERHGNNGNTIQTTVVSGGPQARGNATMIKLESKEIRRERRVREGGEENYPAACRAGRSLEELLRWRRKEAPRAWVAKEGVAGTVTLDSFNKLATRRAPADLSS